MCKGRSGDGQWKTPVGCPKHDGCARKGMSQFHSSKGGRMEQTRSRGRSKRPNDHPGWPFLVVFSNDLLLSQS